MYYIYIRIFIYLFRYGSNFPFPFLFLFLPYLFLPYLFHSCSFHLYFVFLSFSFPFPFLFLFLSSSFPLPFLFLPFLFIPSLFLSFVFLFCSFSFRIFDKTMDNDRPTPRKQYPFFRNLGKTMSFDNGSYNGKIKVLPRKMKSKDGTLPKNRPENCNPENCNICAQRFGSLNYTFKAKKEEPFLGREMFFFNAACGGLPRNTKMAHPGTLIPKKMKRSACKPPFSHMTQ